MNAIRDEADAEAAVGQLRPERVVVTWQAQRQCIAEVRAQTRASIHCGRDLGSVGVCVADRAHDPMRRKPTNARRSSVPMR